MPRRTPKEIRDAEEKQPPNPLRAIERAEKRKRRREERSPEQGVVGALLTDSEIRTIKMEKSELKMNGGSEQLIENLDHELDCHYEGLKRKPVAF